MFLGAFCGFAGDLLFLSAIRKKKITKRKTAGCRSEAKIFALSLKKKNSLRSNSFFFFTGKSKNFFTLLHGGRGEASQEAGTSLRSLGVVGL